MSASGRNVVVVGSGAAGLAAALSAAEEGADVTVLESAAALGGTTATSGGAIWVPGNPQAAAAGVDDSVADGIRYLDTLLDAGDGDRQLARAYVEQVPDVLAAIERAAGITWQHMVGFTDYHVEIGGGSEGGRGLEMEPIHVPQELAAHVRPDPYGPGPTTVNEATGGHPPPGDDEVERRRSASIVTRGAGLCAALYAALVRNGGRALVGRRATELIVDGDRVRSVRADGEDFEGDIVIASGGFERNQQLVRSFLRGPVLGPAGPPSNQGDGQRMGMSAGAALGNMSEAWWCPAMHVPGEQLDGAPFYRMIFTDCAHPGGILVDAHGGRRFVNEATNYNDLGRSLQLFDAARYGDVPAWLVFDAQRFAERPFGGDVVWSLKAGAGSSTATNERPLPEFIRTASSIAALAGAIGAPPDALEESVGRFNTQMRNGGDADYGRGQFTYDRFAQGQAQPRPMGDGPYYALRVLPGTLGTKGGLRTNATGQVLRPNGTPIGGLFAAGNASASPFGRAYPGPGATIGPGLHLGWSAGRAAAAA